MDRKAGTITLSACRELWLQELTQRLTYEGLMEGLPTSHTNNAYLKHLVEEQRAKPSQIPVYLVNPAETLISAPTYPRGSPATLPGVTCIGRFQSPSRLLGTYDHLVSK